MLIDGSGQFMTQRQWPRMALIRTAIDDGALRVSAPGMADLLIALDGSGLKRAAKPSPSGRTACRAARKRRRRPLVLRFPGHALSPVQGRSAARRPAKTDWVSRWLDAHPDESERFSGTHHFGFADGFPLLVASQASLDDLNARLRAKGAAEVPMDRFRPNIVVQGTGRHSKRPHRADRAADVRMAFVKPCTRCSIPDIDQRSAQQFDEPGRTLASYRNLDIGVVFGQNAILDAPAQARLKDWRRGADRTGFLGPADMAAG